MAIVDIAFSSRSAKHGYCCDHALLNSIDKGLAILWEGDIPHGWHKVEALALRDERMKFIIRENNDDLPHTCSKKQ